MSESAPARNHAEIARKYCTDVLAGTVLSCKWVKLACQRHLDDLLESDSPEFEYRFDADKGNRACRFIEALPHVKGRWAARKQLLVLEPWQCFIVVSIFGWLFKSSGLRRFRQAFINVPRKNGKSPLAAGIGLYMLAADGEHGGEIYCGANTEKQAWEVFRPAKLMASATPELLEALGIQVNAKGIVVESTGSRFEAVIGKPGDGASPSCAICDEFHEADTADLYDTFLTGMVGREQPLLLTITTAGVNIASPCHALQLEAQKVLEGTLQDDQLFTIIFTIDEGVVDWTSEDALRMANPNYGISVEPTALRHDQLIAVNNAAKQNIFKTKHLNIWCSANSAFFNMANWNAAADKTLTLEQFLLDQCWIGVDLASTTDLSAVVKVFPRVIDGKVHYYIFARHYLPEDRIDQPGNQHYQKWHHDGNLIATDGAAIDYSVIQADLQDDIKTFKIRESCFDKTYAGQLMQELAAETGATVVDIPQRVAFLSAPMKTLDAAILDGRVHHDGDPVLAWAISNVVAHPDANENVFPRKDKPELKIDAAVATLNALVRVVTAPPKSNWSFAPQVW